MYVCVCSHIIVFQPTTACDIGGFVSEYKGAFVPVFVYCI